MWRDPFGVETLCIPLRSVRLWSADSAPGSAALAGERVVAGANGDLDSLGAGDEVIVDGLPGAVSSLPVAIFDVAFDSVGSGFDLFAYSECAAREQLAVCFRCYVGLSTLDGLLQPLCERISRTKDQHAENFLGLLR